MRRLKLLLAGLACGLVACAPLTEPPLGTRVSNDIGETLLHEWSAKTAQVFAMQGIAKAKVVSPERNGSVTQVVLAEQPDHFRLETLSPFGSPLLVLATNGETLKALATTQNIFYQGAATPENLGRFTRMPLKPADLVSLLLYRVPIIEGERAVFALPEGGWLVTDSIPGRNQNLLFNAEHQLVEVRYFQRDEMFLRVGFGRLGAFVPDFPASFEVEVPEFATSASLDFSEQSINRKFLPGIFELKTPKGSEIISLDDPTF